MEICGEKTTLYGNVRNGTEISVEKHLCSEMCGIVWKSVTKKTLHRNVRISDMVEIWFELASQLDLKCGENLKNYCKKLLVELKYKTKRQPHA